MSKEIWKPVKGFEEHYHISCRGRLKSFKGDPNGRIMSLNNRLKSYICVVLITGQKRRSTRIHRLVAETFIPNPFSKKEVNHIDCNKQNNTLENLEWVTRNENMKHISINKPEVLSGMHHYNKITKAIPVIQKTLDGKVIREFNNCAEASRKTGICRRNIHLVAYKVEYKPGQLRSQAGGFKWQLKDSLCN